VVSTPIGNLGDLSPRAARTLSEADLLVAEDTRHTSQLLAACGIRRPPNTLISLNEHNERARTPQLVERLVAGENLALVSDAGTPLVSDPGGALVAAAARGGITVSAVPGCCAAIAALTLAALPTDRFCFEGFLPAKAAARRRRLELLRHESRTLVFYEAPHRIRETLGDMTLSFGAARAAAIARELTKKFETVYRGTLADLAGLAGQDEHLDRGEIVLIVAGAASTAKSTNDAEADRLLGILVAELPASQAAKLAAQICGRGRRELFERAVALQKRGGPD
jgi:16S rRNA (cytidine1402-2'-O)-methyltransferase